MKRDMDLVRDILLKIEEAEGWCNIVETFVPFDDDERSEKDCERIFQHATWLKEAGFITGQEQLGPLEFSAVLTWDGCEFLETIRDPAIWKKTKAGAKTIGIASVSVLAEIGKGYIKQGLRDKLGLPL